MIVWHISTTFRAFHIVIINVWLLYVSNSELSKLNNNYDKKNTGRSRHPGDYHQGNIYQDDLMEVWDTRFKVFDDRSSIKGAEPYRRCGSLNTVVEVAGCFVYYMHIRGASLPEDSP